MTAIRPLFLVLLMMMTTGVRGHEVRPAYLGIHERAPESYQLLWRVPARGGMRLALYVELPGHCENDGEIRAWHQGGTFVERWSVVCAGGLIGHGISIDGLATTLTDVLVRHERLDGSTQVARLTPSSSTFTVSGVERWQEVAATYTTFGVQHILLGFDHLLFVLALLMLVSGWRVLIATITALTVAHSMTLAAATLGVLDMPQAPVEAVIALSIVLLAAEIVRGQRGREGIARRRPWLVAFAFGLLHGIGFAGALTAVGLPAHAIPLALLFFNIGVEIGQVAFVLAALAAGWVYRSLALRLPGWSAPIPAYCIGALASFWMIERLASF